MPCCSEGLERIAKVEENPQACICPRATASLCVQKDLFCLAAVLLETTSSLLTTKGDVLPAKLAPNHKLPKSRLLIQRLIINATFTHSNASPPASQ